MIRPSLYTYLVSQRIHQDGFRVALCGEGADELFAGYEPLEEAFMQSNSAGRYVQKQCLSMMHRANLQRVDRCSMRFQLEVREPFLDQAIVGYTSELAASALVARGGHAPRERRRYAHSMTCIRPNCRDPFAIGKRCSSMRGR